MHRCLFFLVIFLFAACAGHKSVSAPSVNLSSENNISSLGFTQSKTHEFDLSLMRAYNYEALGLYLLARDEYMKLFLEYQNPRFLENAFVITLNSNLDQKETLNEMAKPFWSKDTSLAKLSAFYYLMSGDFASAKRLLEQILAKEKDARAYELLGDIYLQERNLNAALRNFTLARAHIKEEPALYEILTTKIAETYILLKQKQKAKSELQNYVKQFSCTPRVCLFLAKIYNDENDIEGLKRLYIKLYEATGDEKIIYGLVENLVSEKKYQEALNLALKYQLNNDLLLFLYQSLNKMNEAYALALQIYETSKDKSYLLLAAMLEFELGLSKKQISPELLDSVSVKFEKGIDQNTDAMYLNYYGYLLIDYNKDVKKGMALVEDALKLEPNNPYYLDSLAWGYYKLKDCSKAREIMSKTLHDAEFAAIKETKDHIKAINECELR